MKTAPHFFNRLDLRLKACHWDYFLILAIALGLKWYYSIASADDLEWILRPTAWVVEWMSGIAFVKEAGAGYVSREAGLLIAPACSGINFMIIFWLMAAFTLLPRKDGIPMKTGMALFVIILAFVMTIAVNAVRITLASYLYRYDVSWGVMNAARVHRAEGILIYFFFLTGAYRILDKRRRLHDTEPRRRALPAKNVFNWKHYLIIPAVPFFWYAVLMIGVPLANPAGKIVWPIFLESCFFITLGAAIISGLFLSARYFYWRVWGCQASKFSKNVGEY